MLQLVQMGLSLLAQRIGDRSVLGTNQLYSGSTQNFASADTLTALVLESTEMPFTFAVHL